MVAGETAIVVRVRGRKPVVIERCESRVHRFVEADAYADYDYAGSLIHSGDVLTKEHRILINNVMRARSSVVARARFLGRPLPELAAISLELDLVDGPEAAVAGGVDALAALCDRIASVKGLTDTAASKMLFLLRPRFVPISDSYVRQILGVPDYPEGGVRIASLAAALRELARDNARELGELDRYVRELKTVVPIAGRFKAQRIPLVVSKARILDILLWTEQAIFGATPNPWWKPWWDARPRANGI